MFGRSHEEPEEVDPAEALLREVGAALREARCQRTQAIEDVAETLRIRPAYLAALEQGDLSLIPGRTYALGFLRSYAQYLGFDGKDLIAQIRSSVGGLRGAALQGRTPLTEGRLPKVPILVLSLAALAGAYTGWAYVDRDRAPAELVEEVPPELRRPAQDAPEAPPQAAQPLSRSGEAVDAMPADAGEGDAASREADAAAVHPPRAAPAATANAARPATPQPTVAAARATEADPPPAPGHRGALEAAGDGQALPLVRATVASAGDPTSPGSATPGAAAVAGRGSDAAPRARVVPALAPSPAPAETPAASGAGAATAGRDRAWAPAQQSAVAPEEQPPEADEPARKPRIYGTKSPESRVVLRARDKAWVHVSSTANDYLWVQTLRPGDLFIVPPRTDLVLWTGNAGGVEVLVDGALLPPLGPEAGVVRDVSLRPRALLRRLLPLPEDITGVSDLASAAKPPMMPPSSR